MKQLEKIAIWLAYSIGFMFILLAWWIRLDVTLYEAFSLSLIIGYFATIINQKS